MNASTDIASHQQIHIAWTLFCCSLVFMMQAGFCCLESGLVRSKNSINVSIKNLTDCCVAGILFWVFGFGLMFGHSHGGVIGTSHFLFDSTDASQVVQFLFQLMFCATATTIVAGAVAERMRFSGYIVVAAAISGLIYPIFGHWCWNENGWIASFGFRDFAGATVVHSVGAWVALAACMVIGPRDGRFEQSDDQSQTFLGHNIPLASVGVMLLWMGWFGFNGGSQLQLNGNTPRIFVATTLAGCSGGLAGVATSWLVGRRLDVVMAMNGILAGLVAITACCDVVSFPGACLVGGTGALWMLAGVSLLTRWKVDDVVSAISVHGFAGTWGTLAVAFFGPPESTFLNSLLAQTLGATICFAWSFGLSYFLFRGFDRIGSLRVSTVNEKIGLNIAEHNTPTETYQLAQEMEQHRITGDFSQPVNVDVQSELGQIGSQYNKVLHVVNVERQNLVDANDKLHTVNNDLLGTRDELAAKLNELEEFNELAVDRELRMIELKKELNDLYDVLDYAAPYEVDAGDVPCGPHDRT